MGASSDRGQRGNRWRPEKLAEQRGAGGHLCVAARASVKRGAGRESCIDVQWECDERYGMSWGSCNQLRDLDMGVGTMRALVIGKFGDNTRDALRQCRVTIVRLAQTEAVNWVPNAVALD